MALLSPSLLPKSLYGQVAQAFPSVEMILFALAQSGAAPSTGSAVVQYARGVV